MQDNAKIEEFLKEVNELLNEIKNEQTKLTENVEQYHKVNMRNFEKLKDFNEICDMTNQVFETRLSNIEQILKEKLMKA